MRVLICCEFYHPSLGGVQVVMREIAERLVQRGHEVVVATTRLPERSTLVHNGVRIEEFDVAGNAVYGCTGEVERYREYVAAFDGDAILVKAAQQWTFDALWPVLDRIRARKVFVPCGFSGLKEPDYRDYYAQMPGVLKKFDHLIFYAERYRDIDFARHHGLAHWSVVPNGASEIEFSVRRDSGFRARYGIPEESFVFLTVGAYTGLKGHAEVAQAYALLTTDRPTVLILNGNRPVPRAALGGVHAARFTTRALRALRRLGPVAAAKRALEAFKPDPIARWTERARTQPGKRVLALELSREALVQAYMAADLFVFASHIEYSPLVLFEAAAAGTPFLSVPAGNAEEIARWTGAGMICPAPCDGRGYTRVDPRVLSIKMREAMSDPHRLRELGEAGKRAWRERFTWATIAAQYEALLAPAEAGRSEHAT